MEIGLTILVVAIAYVLGSIPFGVVVCSLVGKDPRRVGSGRTGGTNVYRTAGILPAVITVLSDVAKGYVAVTLAARLVPFEVYGSYSGWAMALSALAIVIGHNYSVFLGFRGGAGSSPNVGALLAYDPVVFVSALLVAALTLVIVRIASVASMAVSTTILLGIAWRVTEGMLPPSALAYGVGQLLIVAWALRPNIVRLRDGTERRIGSRELAPESLSGDAAGDRSGAVNPEQSSGDTGLDLGAK